jgi:hypothetical protein
MGGPEEKPAGSGSRSGPVGNPPGSVGAQESGADRPPDRLGAAPPRPSTSGHQAVASAASSFARASASASYREAGWAQLNHPDFYTT